MDEDGAIRLERPMGWGLRVFLALAGLFCIAAPAIDLLPLLSLHWSGLFVGVILAGAWCLGVLLLAAAFFGERQVLTVSPDRLTVFRRRPFLARTETYRSRDIVALTVVPVTWDGRADSYRIDIELTVGRILSTADWPERREAEDMSARIRQKLDA